MISARKPRIWIYLIIIRATRHSPRHGITQKGVESLHAEITHDSRELWAVKSSRVRGRDRHARYTRATGERGAGGGGRGGREGARSLRSAGAAARRGGRLVVSHVDGVGQVDVVLALLLG